MLLKKIKKERSRAELGHELEPMGVKERAPDLFLLDCSTVLGAELNLSINQSAVQPDYKTT